MKYSGLIPASALAVLVSLSGGFANAFGVQKQLYSCVNASGKTLKLRVSFEVQGGKVVSQFIDSPADPGRKILDYSVHIHKQDTNPITLVENFNSDVDSAIFRCKAIGR